MAVTDLWVDQDGTAYLVGPQSDETPGLTVHREGRRVGQYPIAGLVVAGNREHLFVGTLGGVRILPKHPAASVARPPEDWLLIEGPVDHETSRRRLPDGVVVRGLQATDQHLFVSNAARQRIEQWDIARRQKVREWPFERPGALVADVHEGLWVVRERLLADSADALTRGWRGLRPQDVREPAALVRLSVTDGRILETLHTPEIPTALALLPQAADGAPALLVADNGPLQQILVFSRKDPLRSRPSAPIGNRLGALGQGGNRPTDRRFNGITGLGVSSNGTLYVAQNWHLLCERRGDYPAQCAELLGFSSGLTQLLSASQSLVASHPPSVDPVPPYDVYVRNVRFAVDWGASTGTIWRLGGRTTDPSLFPQDTTFRANRRHPTIRTVLGQTLLFELEGPTLLFSRRDPAHYADLWVPLGAIRAEPDPATAWPTRVALPDRLEADLRHEGAPLLQSARKKADRDAAAERLEQRVALARTFGWMWVDGGGSEPVDGTFQDDEAETLGGVFREGVWSVDPQGGIWLTARETTLREGALPVRFTAWVPERLDAARIPVFRRQAPRAVPAPFSTGGVLWHHHDPASNRMVIAGHSLHQGDGGLQSVCTYTAWNGDRGEDPHPRLAHEVVLRRAHPTNPARLTVANRSDIAALDVVDDCLFALERDPVQVGVYDLRRGNRITTLRPDDECGPVSLPVEGANVQAILREDGEYAVLFSDAPRARLILLRWRPSGHREDPLRSSPQVEGRVHAKRLRLSWSTEDCGVIEGYHVYRSTQSDADFVRLTSEPLPRSFYDDSEVQNGQPYLYAVSIVGAGGVEGPRSPSLRLVPAAPVARFVGEDRNTLGDWPGRYGALGHHLFGDLQSTDNPLYPLWLSAPSAITGMTILPDIRADPALPRRVAPDRRQEHVAGILPVSAQTPAFLPLEIRDGRSVRASVYCGSSERVHGVRIEVVDPETNAVLDAREFSNETETSVRGRYLSWDLTGSVILRICPPKDVPLPDQCGINALFLDEVTALPRP